MTENLSVSVGHRFATVPMWKIHVPHNGDRLWSGELGLGGLSRGGGGGVGSEVCGWGRGIGVGGFPTHSNLKSPDPKPSTPTPLLQPPRPTPDPTLPTSTPLTPNYHRCAANLPHRHCCKRLSDAYAQILGHIRMSHPLCGESCLWRILFVANPLATKFSTVPVRVRFG